VKFNRDDDTQSFDAQLIVGAGSSDDTVKVVEGLELLPGGLLKRTGGWPWQFFPNSGQAGFDSGLMHYNQLGPMTTIIGHNDAFRGDRDVQILIVEFDFFDPGHQDFWSDLATIATGGVDNYMGFSVALKIDMATYTAGHNDSVDIMGCGLWMIQAPNPNNNTCTKLGIGHNTAVANFAAIKKSGYDLLGNDDGGRHRWRYRAGEWDGITSVTAVLTGEISDADDLLFKVYKINPNNTETVIYEQTFSGLNSGNGHVYVRSTELLPSLEDGALYSSDWHYSGAGGTAIFWNSWLEITQANCTKTVHYCDVGKEHDWSTDFNEAPPFNQSPQIGTGVNYWDPIFFQSYPESSVLSNRIYGSVTVQGAINAERYKLRSSLDFVARDDQPANDPLALDTEPQITGSGGRLNEVQWQENDIDQNNPRLLVGPRKLYMRSPSSGVWSGAGFPVLQLGIQFAHLVPPSDVPELGDLFDLSPFNPVGCAATSAGLGDPGVLIITNGSVRPVRFNANARTVNPVGLIPPFCGENPTFIVEETASSPEGLGLVNGTYKYRYTFRNCCTGRESDPSFDDVEVTVSVGGGAKGKVTLSFAGIRVPGTFQEDEICEICVYRTVVGGAFPVMAKVGCFDPLDTELFIDDLDDTQLDFLNDPLSEFNAPMPCVPYVAEYRNRVFGAGDIPDLSPDGTVGALNGSMFIDGDGDVEFDQCMPGRFIFIEGDCRGYEIDQVLPPQFGLSPPLARLKLVEPYEGEDNVGSNFLICGRPNRLFGTEPLEPEFWPVVNFLDIEPGDGDRITGLFSNFDRLGICKRRKTYILAFGDNPFLEINVPARISSDIGCMGPRTFAQIESGTAWLAERGIAVYDGRSVMHVPESVDINDLFVDPDNPRYVRRNANSIVVDAVAVFYPKREQYLLLLPTVQTARGANLMVVWDTKQRNITILEFCQEFQSMVVGRDTNGDERVYLGDTNGFVWSFDIGDTDGVGTPGNTGTVRGIMTDGGIGLATGASFIEDTNATFIVGGLPELGGVSGANLEGVTPSFGGANLGMAGACIAVREDKTKPWIIRTIWLSTSTEVFVTPAWASAESGLRPQAGWEYMLGPIRFEAVFKPTNMGSEDLTKRHWKHGLVHVIEEAASEVLVELLPDFSDVDQFEGDILSDDEQEDTGRTFNMDFALGRQTRKVEKIVHVYMGVRLTNHAPEEPIRIINHFMEVDPRTSR
jgi:hypothetical protein